MIFSPTWIVGAAAAGLLVGALAGGAGAWWVRGQSADREVAELREEVAVAREAAVSDALRLRQAQERAVEKVQSDAERTAAAARRDAAAAADLAGRLRQHVIALAIATAADPPAAGPGPATGGTGLVFADVLGRAEARLRALAGYADQARISGLACERAYEAVRATQ
ncbi:MAG: DUF2514 domain-containing protein [Hydrogenophaga sp.]|nr:DUF2514 domain-containing protein [Hydrogenophaga sp.]